MKDRVNGIDFPGEEITRLKKVINHISKLLESVDKELLPLGLLTDCESIVEECLQQLRSGTHRTDFNYFQLANKQIDGILREVCPYTVLGKSAA